ncbi:hypothetical protein BV25DRAFT_1910992 [Artomyces pyxidatus]|uniref:Uncharacterized protein n=1 Tax=Artomyces pyxidatus TaxID=48021 RepID=A0ACB8TLP2_9AGAM|nr:hypothetical protein BV25DRAFT_1910992 [Artomyces pyxidatus]
MQTRRTIHYYGRYRIKNGHYPVIIVSPESLGNYDGHLPRVARLLRSENSFSRRIKRVLVDEGHFIYIAGNPLYGLAAHRPAWGQLSILHIFLNKATPFQVLSGTLPPHIKSHIVNNLGMQDYVTVTYSSNRPNITYATRCIIGSLGDFRNLDFLMPVKRKVLIFFDSKKDAANAAKYLDNHHTLPESARGRKSAKVYHGDMSPGYLTKTFAEFEEVDGPVKILCATSGCATGIDISDIRARRSFHIESYEIRKSPNGPANLMLWLDR